MNIFYKDRWHTLRAPVGRSTRRSVRRRTGLSITNYGVMSLQREQSEGDTTEHHQQGNVLKAISKWRAGGGAVMFGKKLSNHKPNSNNNNDNAPESQSVKGSVLKLNSFIKSNMSINTIGSKKPKKVSTQSQSKKPEELSVKEPSEQVSYDEFAISDTELEEQFEKIYEQIQERSQFGLLKRKWKAAIDYLEKWPGRFEEIEEIESSSSESSSDDEIDSESQSLKSTDDEAATRTDAFGFGVGLKTTEK